MLYAKELIPNLTEKGWKNMADPILVSMQVTVQFDAADLDNPMTIILPATDPPSPTGQLNVEQGIALIVFHLVTVNQGTGPEAQFVTYPIAWCASPSGENQFNTTIAQPGCFQVHWYNPLQCTVVDTNTALFENPHPFYVVVSYANVIYGSNPVIVNMPPDSGNAERARVQEVIAESEVAISLRKAGSRRKGSNQGRKNQRRS